MLFYVYRPTDAESVSGAWSGNTLSTSGILKQILAISTTSSTTFDLKMVDADDVEVLSRDDETGTLNEMLDLPMKGIYTISIANASVDEDFTIKLIIQER